LSGLLAGLQEKVRETERDRERQSVCVCVCVHFLFFVSLLFCTVFSLDNEKNIHVPGMLQNIMVSTLCEHVDLHYQHADFAQWAC
jgi:hypothetical protein